MMLEEETTVSSVAFIQDELTKPELSQLIPSVLHVKHIGPLSLPASE